MLDAVRELLAGEEAWVVGGAIRDELLGRPVLDLDVAVRDPQAAAEAYAGREGGALGTLFAKAGHPVMFSSRHPEQLKDLVTGLGALAKAGTVAEAVAFGDVVLLVVPYGAVAEIGKEHGKALAAKALVTTAPAARKSIYQQIQLQLNQRGPFIPLLQPTQVFVATSDLKNAVYNAEYDVDVTQVVLAGLTPGGEGKVARSARSKSHYSQAAPRSFKPGNNYYAESDAQPRRRGGFFRRLFGGP